MKQFLSVILSLILAGSMGCGEKEQRQNPAAAEGSASASVDTAAISAFADTSLEAAVRAVLEKPSVPLTRAGLRSLKELDASGRGIVDLKGIEQLENLATLVLTDNRVEDLSPLAALKQLRFLDLDNNRVRDLSPLAGLTQLESLILSHNQISEFAPLLGLEKLKNVELEGNPIGAAALQELRAALASRNVQVGGVPEGELTETPSQEPAALNLFADEKLELQVRQALGKEAGGLTEEDLLKVKKLDFGSYTVDQNNRITVGEVNLEGIQQLLNLTSLRVMFSRISGFSRLAGLDKLTTLELWVGGVEDASALAGLRNLTRLIMGANRIENLSPLAGLTELIYLDLSSNRIEELSPLAGLTKLSVLALGNGTGPITYSGNVDLTENQISDIAPLAKLTGLTRLYLGYNQIRDIGPLMELKNLVEVDLTGNLLDAVSRDTHVPALRARGVSVGW